MNFAFLKFCRMQREHTIYVSNHTKYSALTMDVNTTRLFWLNEVPYEMQMFVKIIEFIQTLILLGSLIGMYRGIEINHPGTFFSM